MEPADNPLIVSGQLAFYTVCFAIWAFFRFTTGQARHRGLTIALWVVLVIGTAGFMAEVWMRGGALPITN